MTKSRSLLTQAYSSSVEIHFELTLGICSATRAGGGGSSFKLKTKSSYSFWDYKSKYLCQTCPDCSSGESVCYSIHLVQGTGRWKKTCANDGESLGCVRLSVFLRDHTMLVVCTAPQRPGLWSASGFTSNPRLFLHEGSTLSPTGPLHVLLQSPSHAPVCYSITHTPFKFQLQPASPVSCAPAWAIFCCHAFTWDSIPFPLSISVYFHPASGIVLVVTSFIKVCCLHGSQGHLPGHATAQSLRAPRSEGPFASLDALLLLS